MTPSDVRYPHICLQGQVTLHTYSNPDNRSFVCESSFCHCGIAVLLEVMLSRLAVQFMDALKMFLDCSIPTFSYNCG